MSRSILLLSAIVLLLAAAPGVHAASASPSKSKTASKSKTPSPSKSKGTTPTSSISVSPTSSLSLSPAGSASVTPSDSVTVSLTATVSPTLSVTSSPSPTPSFNPALAPASSSSSFGPSGNGTIALATVLCGVAAIAIVVALIVNRKKIAKKMKSNGGGHQQKPSQHASKPSAPLQQLPPVVQRGQSPIQVVTQEKKSAHAAAYDPYGVIDGHAEAKTVTSAQPHVVQSTVAEVPAQFHAAAPVAPRSGASTKASSVIQQPVPVPAAAFTPVPQYTPAPGQPAPQEHYAAQHTVAVKTPDATPRGLKQFAASVDEHGMPVQNITNDNERAALLDGGKRSEGRRHKHHKSSRRHHGRSSSRRREEAVAAGRSSPTSSRRHAVATTSSGSEDDTVLEVQREIDEARREVRKDKLRKLLLAKEMVQDQIEQSRLFGDLSPTSGRASPRSLSPRSLSPRTASPRMLPSVAGMLAQDDGMTAISDGMPLVVTQHVPRAPSPRMRVPSPRSGSPRHTARASSPRLSPRLRMVGPSGSTEIFTADQVGMPVGVPMMPMTYNPWAMQMQSQMMQPQMMYPNPMAGFMTSPTGTSQRKDYAWYM